MLIVEAGFNDWLNLSCIVMNSRPSVNTAWFWNDTSPVAELDLTAVETVEEVRNIRSVYVFNIFIVTLLQK